MAMTQDEARWQAIQQRDGTQDGSFFYGVVTTGIYCKPSCRSRQPLQANVRFYDDSRSARAAGLRACLRCKPDQTSTASPAIVAIQKACLLLQNALHNSNADSFNCKGLASSIGMSPSHFHRSFKSVTGITPAQYLKRLRVDRLKHELKLGHQVTRSAYESGFGSSSRLYESSDAQLGMTPGQYRRGGQGITISHLTLPSPLGPMMLGATGRGLCFLQFAQDEAYLLHLLRTEYPSALLQPVTEPYSDELQLWIGSINRFLHDASAPVSLPLDVHATAFQLRVWQYLQAIPRGEVRSYSQVAIDLGKPKASRAVASACAANRVAIVIPCHRVLRNNGELGGFRWGLDRKQKLLALERQSTHVPHQSINP